MRCPQCSGKGFQKISGFTEQCKHCAGSGLVDTHANYAKSYTSSDTKVINIKE